MAQESGFKFIQRHCRSEAGEIDYFYRSEYDDHPLWKQYCYIFAECKNWESVIGSAELDHYIRLLQAKTFMNCFGFYLTTSTLSPEAHTTIRDARMNQKTFIIPVEQKDLKNLIEKGFKSYAQEACDKILMNA